MATLFDSPIHTASLFVYDLETTGTDVSVDRIISMSYVLLPPGRPKVEPVSFLVNPGMPISSDATAIHGIADADVADKPPFSEFAPRIAEVLRNPDVLLCGYNNRKFDDIVLERELGAAGHPVDLFNKPSLDLYAFWRLGEPRTLAGAMKRFLGGDLAGAHNAENDAQAVASLLTVMMQRFEHVLPSSLTELNAALFPEQARWVDRTGKIVKNQRGEPSLSFGKHRGVPLRVLDKGYLEWILTQNFPDDTKAIIQGYLPPASPE